MGSRNAGLRWHYSRHCTLGQDSLFTLHQLAPRLAWVLRVAFGDPELALFSPVLCWRSWCSSSCATCSAHSEWRSGCFGCVAGSVSGDLSAEDDQTLGHENLIAIGDAVQPVECRQSFYTINPNWFDRARSGVNGCAMRANRASHI